MKDYQERVRQLYKPNYTTVEIAMDIYDKLPKLHNLVNRVELVMRGGPDDGKLLPLLSTAESKGEVFTH
jgi:hypothetical protein